jgi:hypothetical protein
LPCYRRLQKKASRLRLKLDEGLATDRELQDLLQVGDHESVHAKLDEMSDGEVLKLVQRVLENATKKRAKATERNLVAAGVA